MSAPENTEKTRILVLEEHPLLRHGITDYLDSQPDMIVCGEADNLRDARNKLAECKASVTGDGTPPGVPVTAWNL
ncbi:MAG TPA: hypothetical protein VKH14_04260 [Candidatus Udaeobacter sp.]|nr:hypothetical protein [Candidatus Udaeobacter sp.]